MVAILADGTMIVWLVLGLSAMPQCGMADVSSWSCHSSLPSLLGRTLESPGCAMRSGRAAQGPVGGSSAASNTRRCAPKLMVWASLPQAPPPPNHHTYTQTSP